MDKFYSDLDRHFHLPAVRHVEGTRPFKWLRQGWNDMRDNPTASLAYGFFFAAIGYLILAYAADMPYLFTAAISGFFLVGPIAAAGLYEISRRHEAGEPTTLRASLGGLARHGESLMYAGLLLAFMLIGWERISAVMFALFYGGNVPDLSNFASEVFFSGDYVQFVVAYMTLGGALALLVFSLMAVALPMVMHRETDLVTAMMTSSRAVGANLGAMALWGALIVALVGIGFGTLMLGMVFILPWLGHATWHAYRDLVE